MHLASSRELPTPPSNFELACRVLRDVLRQEPHAYFLWTQGAWVHADVDAIMKRANVRLKSMGRPQFTNKREWIA